MALGMAAWLSAGRLRGRRRLRMDFPERRRELVRRLAPGGSFIDVGGMWNSHGEIAFLAEDCGAERVVMFDAMEPTEEFAREQERRGSGVEFVRGDLHDPDAIAALGSYDVVWCTGVVYHSPDPFGQLQHLRRLCERHLLLGSHVIPEVPGIEQACIWYPGISDRARAALRQAHGGARAPSCLGVTEPFDPEGGYANYWWGISRSALTAMVATAGFEVIEEYFWTTFLADLLARPAGTPAAPR
jgi:SAM-dependent methyltransferase